MSSSEIPSEQALASIRSVNILFHTPLIFSSNGATSENDFY